jgi:hypothetical protein
MQPLGGPTVKDRCRKLEHGDKMECKAHEVKTWRDRTIRITDSEII